MITNSCWCRPLRYNSQRFGIFRTVSDSTKGTRKRKQNTGGKPCGTRTGKVKNRFHTGRETEASRALRCHTAGVLPPREISFTEPPNRVQSRRSFWLQPPRDSRSCLRFGLGWGSGDGARGGGAAAPGGRGLGARGLPGVRRLPRAPRLRSLLPYRPLPPRPLRLRGAPALAVFLSFFLSSVVSVKVFDSALNASA